MSLRYTRQPGDEAYRKVSLNAPRVPNTFTEFHEESETIFCNGIGVIEVRRSDGTCFLVGTENGKQPQRIRVHRNNGYFSIDEQIPTARLWIQRSDGTGIRYKTPIVWEADPENRRIRCMVPGGVNSLRLVGDPYFQAVYELFE